MSVGLYFRKRIVVNTDDQRRCYSGCNFSSEEIWTDWTLIGPYSMNDAISSKKTFEEINPGREYKIEELA